MVKLTFILSILVLGVSVGHAQELTADKIETCKQRVIEKIDDFISYLPEIASKNKSADEQKLAQKYINKALELFIGEGEDYEFEDQAGNKRMHEAVKMQTTSRGRANAPLPMKSYLNRLARMHYQKINVDSAEIYIPEKIIHFGNGLHIGLFNIIMVKNIHGKAILDDEHMKKIKLYFKPEPYMVSPNGDEQIVWPVKIGNVYVTNKFS